MPDAAVVEGAIVDNGFTPCDPAQKMIVRAAHLHRRAARKPVGSNGRLKDEAQSRGLVQAAVTLAAAHGCPPDHTMSWIRDRYTAPAGMERT